MGTVLKVGDQDISTFKNMVQYPVPYSSGQITIARYSGDPDPLASISYLLNQLDGPTTHLYGQYLEDYARVTIPLLGAGTESDPYYFYPYRILTRSRLNVTAADFEGRAYLNAFQYYRLYSGVVIRLTSHWYTSSNIQVYSRSSTSITVPNDEWNRIVTSLVAPPQTTLNQVSYVVFGIEIVSGMNASQNYYDVTGFRATPVSVSSVLDERSTYWDGSTTFTQSAYVSNWESTPRASKSVLTITDISTTTEETEAVKGLSVSEDVTGRDPSSLSGGTGQARATIPYEDNTPNYLGLSAELQDFNLGNFYGRVRNLGQTTDAGSVEVTIDESMSLLNAWVTAPPMSGTVNSVLRNYAALTESPVRTFAFENGVGDQAANVPGFVGNLYDKVREFLAAYNAELVTIDGVHVVRATMQNSLVLENYTDSPSVVTSLQETAQYVRMHWYDNEYVTNGEVYPPAANPQETEEDVTEPTIYSVGAGEVLKVDIQLRASLLSVNNPTYVAFVPDESVTGSGVYTAVGSDSLPITPSQWAAGGGDIDVQINSEDPSVLSVTITGPNFPLLAPFRLAMSSGSGNYYNALHITGTGVFVRDQYLDFATGALPGATGQRYSVECTNPFISTKEQAYQAGQVMAGNQAQVQTITFSVPSPARVEITDDPVLGLLPGSKFVHNNQQFRIESTDVNHHTVSGNGVYALTVADYDHFFTRSTPFTVNAFNALYAGSTITAMNFSLKPLLHRFVEV